MSPRSWTSLPPATASYPCMLSQNSLYYTVSISCSTYGNVYVSMLLSQFVPLSPSLTVSTSLFSMSESLFSSVTQSCPTLCDPTDCSMPGLPVHHQLTEFTQTQVHWVSDAIQTSHPLLSPSPPAFNLSQHQGLFKWIRSSNQVAKYWSFSFSIRASVLPMNIQNWFPLEWTGWISLQSKGLSRVFSKPQFESINSLVLSFLYSPTLTSIHDHWRNYIFD